MSNDIVHSASTNARIETQQDLCVITHEKLDIEAITNFVRDDEAGAVALFIGTTRNSFKGKVVTKLEYQAYSKLAIKTLAQIVLSARSLSSRSEHQPTPSGEVIQPAPSESLIKCAVYHRLGTVPVGEPSIVIAVSSPHRKEAFRACEHILEEVKLKAQIWKREFYQGEDASTAQWKANTG